MKTAALSKIKTHLSEYLRTSKNEEVVITRHGKPVGVLIGFKTADDWTEYQLQNDPRFLQRIASAKRSLRKGKGVRIEDLSE